MAEFNRVRQFWDDHWATNPRCIKTLADFRDFALFHDMTASLEPKDATYLKKKGSTPDLYRLQRDLCRAFKHGEAGLDAYQSMTAAEFAQALNDAGLEAAGVVTSRRTVENGKRVELKPHSTQRSAAVLNVVERLCARFPLFDPSVLLANGVPDDELAAALSEPCNFIDQVRQVRSDSDEYGDASVMSAASVDLY